MSVAAAGTSTPLERRVGAPRDVAWSAAPGAQGTALDARGEPQRCETSTAVSVLVLARVPARALAWGWSRLVRGPAALQASPGLRFAKVLGSGHEGGFGLRPSATRHGLFCIFDDDASAAAFVTDSRVLRRYRDVCDELFTVRLRATSCKGRWAGVAVPVAATAPPAGMPIAALTRASIRPLAAPSFWRMAPAAQAGLASAPGCRLAVGLGEAPLLRQCTFSLWDDLASMEAYARRGAHLEAIRAAGERGYFSESMFVRFVPADARGTWLGRRYGPDVPEASDVVSDAPATPPPRSH